jgi:hypothetical protein
MEILPCPFCGKQPKILKSFGTYKLRCDCELKPTTGIYFREKNAVQAWNKRKEDDGSKCPGDPNCLLWIDGHCMYNGRCIHRC